MIQIYKHDNTTFSTNGDMTLMPSKCELEVKLNGICELTLEHSYDKEGRWEYILEDAVIKAPTPFSEGQLFRIYKKVKGMFGVVVYARHIFFDLIDYPLIDVTLADLTGQQALNIILNNTPFTGHSNILTVNTGYYARKNIVEALANDDENSFVNKWGGERFLDNFTLTINDKIGSDNGVSVLFGKNLEDIEEDITVDPVATRLYPEGDNGITLDNNGFVDSPNILKYANIKRRFIKFDDIKVKENPEDTEGFNTLAEAQAEMRRRCNDLFTKGLDAPTVNYKINMQSLRDTTDYKDYEILETINLGDTVTCKHNVINIDVKARCISYIWDCITKKYIEIELGQFIANYLDKIADIDSRVQEITGRIDNVLTGDDKLRAEEVKGFLNGTQTKLKASRGISQTQEQRVIDFEDLDPSSPTYGSTILGTQGIFVADTRNPENTDWVYTSALTAKGLVAEKMYGKLLAGEGVYFDLVTGKVYFKKGKIEGSNSSWDLDTGVFQSALADGSKIVISPTDGFYNEFSGNKKGYHHLNYTGTVSFTGTENDYREFTITLPEEFKGKDFTVKAEISELLPSLFPSFIVSFSCHVQNKDIVNGTFTILISSSHLGINYSGADIIKNDSFNVYREAYYTVTA